MTRRVFARAGKNCRKIGLDCPKCPVEQHERPAGAVLFAVYPESVHGRIANCPTSLAEPHAGDHHSKRNDSSERYLLRNPHPSPSGCNKENAIDPE